MNLSFGSAHDFIRKEVFYSFHFQNDKLPNNVKHNIFATIAHRPVVMMFFYFITLKLIQ